jgi:hypothetical protein
VPCQDKPCLPCRMFPHRNKPRLTRPHQAHPRLSTPAQPQAFTTIPTAPVQTCRSVPHSLTSPNLASQTTSNHSHLIQPSHTCHTCPTPTHRSKPSHTIPLLTGPATPHRYRPNQSSPNHACQTGSCLSRAHSTAIDLAVPAPSQPRQAKPLAIHLTLPAKIVEGSCLPSTATPLS